MFLAVNKLVKKYHQQTVLHGLTFDVHKGEILVVLGPSGCGKSTLLSCLNGFTTVDGGHIYLQGQEITTRPPERRNITTVFQSYSLFPNMTVRQNISYGLKFQRLSRKEKNRRTTKMLQLLQLEDYADAHVQELSGGQQQRVALGRSLVVEPQLLLLDEPFSNLDEKLRLAMRKQLRRIQQQLGTTMIFVTHDQQEAFDLGDRIMLMNAGRIQQLTTGPQLYNNPNNEFALHFIGAVNQLANNEYVRPETIQLRKDKNGTGKIIARKFQGATIVYQLVDHHQVFQVMCLNRGPQLTVGDPVTIDYQVRKLGEKK